ncbi:E3 ubiquitin-protein ligase TRIM56-like [Littorina saxatilis]|uniref:Uncharacterized protein n=1 Tax=Littorina saxatilis TaxID=31220 RepID=A0AAN9GN90_9CAEN
MARYATPSSSKQSNPDISPDDLGSDCGQPNKLTCALCLERFRVPKILPCFHTFCQHCLEDLVIEDAKTFLCPNCRRNTVVPAKGAKDFQTNFYIEDDLAQETPFGQRCEAGCAQGNAPQLAVSRCHSCEKFYCQKCITVHNSIPDVKAKHHWCYLRNGGPLNEEERKVYCKKHPDQTLCFWCVPCKTSICVHCKLTLHESHASEDRKDAERRAKVELGEIRDSLTHYVDTAKAALATVEKNITEIDNEAESKMDEIETRAERLVEMVKDSRRDELSNIEFLRDDLTANMKDRKKALKGNLKAAQTTLDHTARVLAGNNSIKRVAQIKRRARRYLEEDREDIEETWMQTPREWFPVRFSRSAVPRRTVVSYIGSCQPESLLVARSRSSSRSRSRRSSRSRSRRSSRSRSRRSSRSRSRRSSRSRSRSSSRSRSRRSSR